MNPYSKFPKIIHQVWHVMPGGPTEIPDKWKPSQEAWQKFHPDHQYILWTNEKSRNYIAEMEPDFLSTYDNLEYEIQRIDAIRYVFLKHMGGIYSDLDLQPMCNITDKITTDAPVYLIRSLVYPFYSYRNDFMISKPGVQFWDICIEMIKSKATYIPCTKGTKVLSRTGPYMITEAAMISNDDICQLGKQFGSRDPRCGYFKDLGGRSWNGWDVKVYNVVYSNFIWILLIIIIVVLAISTAIFIKHS